MAKYMNPTKQLNHKTYLLIDIGGKLKIQNLSLEYKYSHSYRIIQNGSIFGLYVCKL